MCLQQNMDKMPKFASLSNLTYQINNTLNACVEYYLCILCIVVSMNFKCSSPNKISVLFCFFFINSVRFLILGTDNDLTNQAPKL